MTTTADLLNEYGSSIRGDWGSIDGRSERTALSRLASAIQAHGNEGLSEEKVREIRDALGVCPHGEGHWEMYCSDYCEGDEQ